MAATSNKGMRRQSAWPLSERPGFLARRFHQIHVSLFADHCAAFGVTPLQYSLLTVLSEREEADQTTLANLVSLDRTTTTGALKRLEARQLIRRGPSASDRRSQTSALTDAGRDLHRAMESAARHAHEETVEPLNAEEQALLIALLTRIVAIRSERREGAPID